MFPVIVMDSVCCHSEGQCLYHNMDGRCFTSCGLTVFHIWSHWVSRHVDGHCFTFYVWTVFNTWMDIVSHHMDGHCFTSYGWTVFHIIWMDSVSHIDGQQMDKCFTYRRTADGQVFHI